MSALTYRLFVTETDFAPLVALLGAVEAADQDGEDVSEATLREQLHWPGHEPERDRVVARADDGVSLAGYGALFKTSGDLTADVYVAVHPSWRREGAGARLLSLLVEYARSLGVEGLRCYANASNPGATAFAHAQGFTPVASYTRLVSENVSQFASPPPPLPGFYTRTYDQIGDPTIFMQAANRTYEGLWGHHQLTVEEVAQWLPALAPEGILLLFAETGAIAGTCRVEMNARLSETYGRRTALVDAPGVVPEYRDQGLYRQLLLHALHWAIQQQAERIEIESWGDTPATLGNYRALGFTTMQEAISYQRAI